MRNRFIFLSPVLGHLGALLWTVGFVLLVPLVPLLIYARTGRGEVLPLCYLVPAVLAMALGLVLKRRHRLQPLNLRGAMLLGVLGWVVVSAIGAIPFHLGLGLNYLDSFFEAVSGFTTTGITMLSGLDQIPRSILFWRALMQWVGGLGIVALFLFVVSSLSSAHTLFGAESHKVFSRRPAPGLFHTLKILWSIYAGFTVLIAGLLFLEGVPLFDVVVHSLTSVCTGGFSSHDANIGYYAQVGHPHFVLIEYTIVFAMVLGGLNFFIHYRVFTGGIRALWDSAEVRLFWTFLAGATILVTAEHFAKCGFENAHDNFRHSAFQVVSMLTTAGFATRDIGGAYFSPLAKQAFLVLMVVGGCVGSTSGGFKVLRVCILFKMVGRQVRRIVHGRSAVNLVLLDGERIDVEEVHRVAALFFAWVMLLVIGSGVTALLSTHGPLESASGMFSVLNNVGPCYITAGEMAQLHPLIKLTYIIGMVAGRLEILPVLVLFTRRTWR